MVSVSLNTGDVQSCFNIEKLLLDSKPQTMTLTLPAGTECSPTESAFKALGGDCRPLEPGTAVTESLTQAGTFIGASLSSSDTSAIHHSFHRHRDIGEYCSQCYQSSTSHCQDNLFNNMKPYEMSTQCISNINNNRSSNLIRSTGHQVHHQWPMLDTAPRTSDVQSHDIRAHRNLGEYGLKFRNSFMQLDSLSNISNIASLANNYSPFSSMHTAMGQSQLRSHIGQSRADHNVGLSGHTFPWTTSRGTGFLTGRCVGKLQKYLHV